jgi:hypothetical protein
MSIDSHCDKRESFAVYAIGCDESVEVRAVVFG